MFVNVKGPEDRRSTGRVVESGTAPSTPVMQADPTALFGRMNLYAYVATPR